MAFLRAIIVGAVVALFVAGPVYGQSGKSAAPPATPEDMNKKREQESIDKAYKATLERTRRDAATDTRPNDPWANMRGEDTKTKR